MNGQDYEMDLVLRNNITTDEHPLGVYHPHAGLHHIKKENIGLIEVMGLAVLPARLDSELRGLEQAIPLRRRIPRPSWSRRWARCSPACWRTPACTSARTRAARPSCASLPPSAIPCKEKK